MARNFAIVYLEQAVGRAAPEERFLQARPSLLQWFHAACWFVGFGRFKPWHVHRSTTCLRRLRCARLFARGAVHISLLPTAPLLPGCACPHSIAAGHAADGAEHPPSAAPADAAAHGSTGGAHGDWGSRAAWLARRMQALIGGCVVNAGPDRRAWRTSDHALHASLCRSTLPCPPPLSTVPGAHGGWGRQLSHWQRAAVCGSLPVPAAAGRGGGGRRRRAGGWPGGSCDGCRRPPPAPALCPSAHAVPAAQLQGPLQPAASGAGPGTDGRRCAGDGAAARHEPC